MRISEFQLIEMLKRGVPKSLQGDIGLGDDAAVLSFRRGRKVLFSADTVVEGVDFKMGQIQPEMAGRKALAVNLSDIAAMGGTPFAFVSALGLPRKVSERWIKEFHVGMVRLARQFQVSFVGGDVTASKQFFASIAILGYARKAILRRGAKPGDLIGVTGDLGGSILEHHYRFMPRLREGQYLARHFHPSAMIDISDGLWQDCEHMMKASGVCAKLDADKVPVSKAALTLSKNNRKKALGHALGDGEDFELLFTLPQKSAHRLDRHWKKRFPNVRLSWIGRVLPGKAKQGIVQCSVNEFNRKTIRKGYSHF
ncbi:MAG: thiamine-monophosphate kinase [Candidatus Omnitrophica bacterium]|nr:thiamine-monophosphate kinase [Candidatus Omnitrophota bacterium]